MSLLRAARQPAFTRPVATATAAISRPSIAAVQQRAYADQKTNGAKPKILNENPPDEKNASEEVKAHNKEVERRAERPSEKVKEEEVEKDKVPKGYWQGSQAGSNKESI